MHLPWTNLPRRWSICIAIADVVDRVITSAGLALKEWTPLRCRPATLAAVWAAVIRRPQRDGESIDDYRGRLAAWRNEPVGTRGWVRAEVERQTGAQRVIDFPRESLRVGYSRVGQSRVGEGPTLVIGAAEAQQEALRAKLARELAPDIELNIVDVATYDLVRYGPPIVPVADAGADRWETWNATVTLDGSRSDSGGGLDITSYAWLQTSGPTVTLSDTAVAAPTFQTPSTDADLTFELTVTNTSRETATDSVTIRVGQPAEFSVPSGRSLVFVASLVRGTDSSDLLSLYRHPDNDAGSLSLTIGALRDGSLEVGDTTISRVTRVSGSPTGLSIQNHPDTENLGTEIGTGAEAVVRLAPEDEMTLTTVQASGSDYYRWTTTTQQDTDLDEITVGRSFVIAVHVAE